MKTALKDIKAGQRFQRKGVPTTYEAAHDALACRARGYVYITCDKDRVVNAHGSEIVEVLP